MLRRPGPALADAVTTGGPSLGPKAALLTGALWAIFAAILAAGGHEPSGPIVLPISRANYYAWQTAFVIPTYVAMFYASSGVMHGLAHRLGGEARWSQTRGLGGLTMALSSILGWWLPDVLVYAVAGFAQLAEAVRYCAAISLSGFLLLGTAGLGTVHRLSTGRALFAVCVAWMVQASISAPLLR